MTNQTTSAKADPRFLLKGIVDWLVTAALLLPCAALLLHASGAGSRAVLLTGLAVQLLSSIAAGRAAGGSGAAEMKSAALCGLLISALLLLIQLLLRTGEPSVLLGLRMVAITFTGCLIGAALRFPGKAGKTVASFRSGAYRH